METEKQYVAHAEALVEIVQKKTDKPVTVEYSNWGGTPTISIGGEDVAEFHKPKYNYGSIPYITVRCGWYGEKTIVYKMLKNGTFSYAKIADEMVERYNQYVVDEKSRKKHYANCDMSSKLASSLSDTLGINYKIQSSNYADKVTLKISKDFTAERLTEFVTLLRANGFADLLDF
jgi:hypothetical protein